MSRANFYNALIALVFSVLIWGGLGAQLSGQEAVVVNFVLDVPDDVTVEYMIPAERPGELPRVVTSLGSLEVPIQVTLRGPREVVRRVRGEDVVGRRALQHDDVVLQRALQEGTEAVVEITEANIRPLGERLEVVALSPRQLERVRFSRVITRDVAIEPRVQGTPAPGFLAGRAELSRNRVTVVGAQSVLDAHPGPYKTLPVDISGVRDSVVDERGIATPPGITTSAKVLVKVPILPRPEPRTIRFRVELLHSPPSGKEPLEPWPYVLEPRGDSQSWTIPVELEGPREVLNRIEQQLAGEAENRPRAFIRTVELSPPQAGTTEIADTATIRLAGLPPEVQVVKTVDDFPVTIRRKQP